MERIARKREQSRLRMKKSRAIENVLQELNTSSSSSDSSGSPPVKNAKGRPIIYSDIFFN